MASESQLTCPFLAIVANSGRVFVCGTEWALESDTQYVVVSCLLIVMISQGYYESDSMVQQYA